MALKIRTNTLRKQKTTRILDLRSSSSRSSCSIIFDSLLRQMLRQYSKLSSIRNERKNPEKNNSLQEEFSSRPLDYREMVVVLRTILRTETERVIIQGKQQMQNLLTRVKELLNCLPQLKKDVFLNINLWLTEKMSNTSCMPSLCKLKFI